MWKLTEQFGVRRSLAALVLALGTGGCATGATGGLEQDVGPVTAPPPAMTDAGDMPLPADSGLTPPADSGLTPPADATVPPAPEAGVADSGSVEDSGQLPGPVQDSGTPEPDAAMPDTCQPSNTCESAIDVGSVAGDINNDVVSRFGQGGQWLSVDVTDTGGEGTGGQLEARVELRVPDGSDYDLVLFHANPQGRASLPKDCSNNRRVSSNLTGNEVLDLSWSDGQNILFQDAGDGLILSMEVVHVSGPCAQWELVVSGNP